MDNLLREKLERRKAEALERVADELEFQSAVLTELAHAQHVTAVSANEYSEPAERAEHGPTYASLLTRIEDQQHTREQRDDEPLLPDGGDDQPTREELAKRVEELERKMQHVTAHNRRDTAPEGSW